MLVRLEWGNVEEAVTAGPPHPLLCTKVLKCTNEFSPLYSKIKVED